tara:strand:+ start:3144 stop:5264 length:2121 start_codon:yes stop_codon:yes gene_type:complete
MSVLNRKMFRSRNARNALNRSAGIPAVASFQTGGSINPLTRRRTLGTTTSLSGLPGIYTAPKFTGPLARANVGELAQRYISGKPLTASEFSVLRGAEQGFLSGQGLNQSMGQFGKTRLGSGIRSILNPMAQAGGNIRGFLEGATGTAAKTLLGSSDGSMPADKVAGPQLSKDYLESLGISFLDPTNLQTASSRGGPVPPSAFGKAVPSDTQIKNPFEDQRATKQRIDDERIAREEMERIGSVVGNEEAGLSPSGFLPTTTPSLESATDNAARAAKLAAGKDIEDGDVLIETEATVDDGGEDDATPGTGTGTGEGSGVDGAPNTQQEINDVINKGTQVEQTKALDGFIKEFMDAAPSYEGANSGLILAKIGFAMAAGKSPNAIQNIASALSDGADMLIKDKAKKDEFNRQLKLSAMQYGFTEVGKLRAEERLEAREGRGLNYFVAEADVTINGKKYKKGNTVPVSTAYIRENGLPGELQTTELAKAAITANSAYQKALLKAKEKNIIDPKTYTGLVEKLNQASTDFQSANSMRTLVEGNIIRNAEGNITGLGPAFNDLLNKAYNTVGVKAPEEYESVAKYNQDLRRVSNLLLKDLLGEGSKNVSNIDRKLADEIVGLHSSVGGYITSDPDLLNERLQNILVTLDQKESNALNIFRGASESTEGFTFRSGKAVDFNIPAEARALLGEQNVQGLVKYGVGDDGVYRRLS